MKSLVSQSTTISNKSNASRKNSLHLPLASLAMAISAINYAPAVTAQDQQQSMRFLEEVVVTARRREESQQDVPIAITTMNEDFLRKQNITSIESIGTQVPSVRISSGGTGTSEPVVTIRGQRPSEAAIQLDPAAPMYFNDVVMLPSVGTNLAMYDLQNLQILKGPQGTLFGRNSTGGALLMTPTRPGDSFGGYAEVKLGDYNLRSVEGAVDLPVTDNLSMRLVGRKVTRDGYQENIADNALNGDDVRGENSQGVRLSINYQNERLNNLTVLSYDKDRFGSPMPQLRALNTSTQGGGIIAGVYPEYLAAIQENIDRDDPWKFKSDVKSEDKIQNVFASNTFEFELNDNLTVKNILGYRKVKANISGDADGTALPVSGHVVSTYDPAQTDYVDNGYGLGITGADLHPEKTDPTIAEQYTAELQLIGNAFDDRLDWIAGAYWSQMEGTSKQVLMQMPARWSIGFPGVFETNATSALNTGYAVFGEATYRFSDEWSLTFGARQSWDERELTVRKFNGVGYENITCAVTGPGGAPLDTCERTVKEDFERPTGRLSINYTPDDGTLYYGSVSTGYKAGGFNSRGTNDTTLQSFDPETVTTFELGSKLDWTLGDMPLRTNLAVYLQKYEDIQQTIPKSEPGGALATQTVNAAKAEIKGFEADITLLPTDNLSLSLSYSYVDAGFDKNEASIADGYGGIYQFDTSDNDFVYIPEQSLSASATYILPVDESLGEMSIMATVYWQDEMSTHQLLGDFAQYQNAAINPAARWTDANVALAESVSKADAYDVWNLRFDWRNMMGSNFDMAVFMNNVTDEQYILGGLNVIDVFYTGYTYGAPRTFGASLRYQF